MTADCPRPTAPPPTPCRLILDDAAAGAWNMAVDEVLWDWAAQENGCVWRFYRWQEPTLSLGYFQQWDDRRQHPASRNCPVVRRPSGGGAILHDRELTYSFALPATHAWARRHALLYTAVHRTLIETLADWGVQASLCGAEGNPGREGHSPQPFLCFQRRACGDVLVGGTKVAGSAQRRSRGAILQHGSVLLARSPAAPELAGLDAFTKAPLATQRLVAQWLDRLGPGLGLAWNPDPLTRKERALAEELVPQKYGNPAWTRTRGRQE